MSDLYNASGFSGGIFQDETTNALSFWNSAAPLMTLDNSGNLGIGVTPSAWVLGGYKALEVNSAGNGIYSGLGDTLLTCNAYYSSGWKYASTGVNSSFYEQNSGNHIWKTAPTGTVGNAITFTEAMRISASGGVSIGNTTDPGATNLSVTGTGKFGTTVSVGAATPSASGAGITFPATQSASTNANTLDDYEEGTWTPTITGATTAGTGVYVLQQGSYTKIGNQVTVWFRILWSAHTGTGSTVLTGLPFTINASNVSFDFIPIASQSVAYTSGKTLVAAWGATGLTYTGFDIGQVGASSVYVVLTMATTGDLFGSVTYFV